MGARSDRVDAAKIAELKLLYERGWLGQHCSNVLADRSGIHREEGQSGEDAFVAFRQKRLERKRELNQNQRAQYPARGSQCDVMIDPASIVANPAGTPIEAPAAMRPDSPAAPVPLRPQPHSTSLRGRVEGLLAQWERDRSTDLTAARDSTLPDCIREAAQRSADVGGIYIEELDQMYHDYLREIA